MSDTLKTVTRRLHKGPHRIYSSIKRERNPHNPHKIMTFDSFVCDPQIEDDYIPTEDDWMSFYENDQDLEAFSLECAFGPEE